MTSNRKNKAKTIRNSPEEYSENIKLHRDLKSSSYRSSLKRIRKQLPSSHQRLLSSYVHGRGMDSFNDLVANTIARPKSVLAGSILAAVGVIGSVYLAINYGYSYNYLLMFLFFVFGYLAELIIELIIRFFVRYK